MGEGVIIDWENPKRLKANENVVYNFHYYNPMIFLHQGAAWGWEMLRHFRRIPHPSSPEAVREILPFISVPQARQYVIHYGEERWNRERLREHILPARKWAAEHGVPVTVNEFGAYPAHADPEAVNRYLADLRSIFEEFGFGWATWDLDWITVGSEGSLAFRPGVLKALGLAD